MLTGGMGVQIWDLREGRSVRSVFGPHLCGDGLDLAGSTLLTAQWAPTDQLQVTTKERGRQPNQTASSRDHAQPCCA